MANFMKICIIDDNTSITGMFAKFLTIQGYEVTVRNGGKEGLDLLNAEKFDITLLDISMPGFSGIDVITALHDSGRIKEQKIMVLTASTSTLDELGIMKGEIKEILKKPLELSTLKAKIEEHTKE
jgi:DNA-binding response OmpR family regulator